MSTNNTNTKESERMHTRTPALSQYIPQYDEQILGPVVTFFIPEDHNLLEKPETPNKLQVHYCKDCEVSWLVGQKGLRSAQCHPSHHTLYHEYTGQTKRSMVVHVDGACLGPGPLPRISSVGVYFGPNSKHNISRILPDEHTTTFTPEISAAIAALRHIRLTVWPQREELVRANSRCRANITWPDGWTTPPSETLRSFWHFRLIIVSNSASVVDFTCKQRHVWTMDVEHGVYLNGFGKKLKNGPLFAELLGEIELVLLLGIEIQWHFVPHPLNRDADGLARDALAGDFFYRDRILRQMMARIYR